MTIIVHSQNVVCICVFTEKTLHQWKEFDHSYEELSEWLKDMEVKVKGVKEAKATLAEKQDMHDKYKAYHEEVRGKQGAFDSLTDRTQFLLQTSTDSRITAQLTQLNSRYTALTTFTKVRALGSFFCYMIEL